jgi:hypothetical protein
MHQHAALAAEALGDQRQVDRALGEAGQQFRRGAADHVHLDARMGLAEPGQDLRQEGAGIVVGCPDRDLTRHRVAIEGGQRFLVHPQDAAGVAQQQLAVRRQRHRAAVAGEQLAAQHLLQPLDLHAYGRLGTVDPAGGRGEAAGLRDCHEAAQELRLEAVEHAPFHQER